MIRKKNPVSLEDDPTANSIKTFPNTFNSAIAIDFTLLEDDRVSLSVQNVYGQEIMSLMHKETHVKGHHTKQFNLSQLPAGIYFFVLKSNSSMHVQKLVKTD